MPTPPRTVFATPWFAVEEIAADGAPGAAPWYRIRGPDGVICLVLTEDDRIVLVRQHRAALQAATIEMPAGSVDPGESVEAAAAREIAEECGFACRALVPLGPGRLMLNRHSHREYFFLGIGARPLAGWVPEGGVAPLLVPRAAFGDLVRSGAFEQAAALAVFTLAELRLGVRLLTDPLELIERRAAAA